MQLNRLMVIALVCGATATATAQIQTPSVAPSLAEVLAAKTDLWGDSARQLPTGPSYEFFSQLLPPLRYVNADFHHYPIVLSAPLATVKARWVSNGSAVNARAGLDTWFDPGSPIHFILAETAELFGEDLGRLHGPHLLDGWLPIVSVSYQLDAGAIKQECFAACGSLAEFGAVFVKFSTDLTEPVEVHARLDDGVTHILSSMAMDNDGNVWMRTGESWKWDAESAGLSANVDRDQPAFLLIYTHPGPQSTPPLTAADYDQQRFECESTWRGILERGVDLQIPETVVQNAWRSLLVSNLAIASGGDMNYSAGNSYQRMFCEESSVAIHALDLYGLHAEARGLMDSLLNYQQHDLLSFHNVGFKLQALCRRYWLVRDRDWIDSIGTAAMQLAASIPAARAAPHGLLPAEAYCGDIHTLVVNLNSNSNAWRGLRDWAAVLQDRGDGVAADELTLAAADLRTAIIQAAADNQRLDSSPPFVPVALFGTESPYEHLTGSQLGSYWTLTIPYTLRSDVFHHHPDMARAIAEYLETHGGLCMGMVRFDQHSGLFANTQAVDDLYTLGYVDYLLREDQVDRALVSFYGKLAQGLTQNTFVGAEGTGLVPEDKWGRGMYLPPNATSQSFFLWMLRQLLVQDLDTDDDGRPESLRLLFATPRSWLADQQELVIERMPTAFGTVSIRVRSQLERGFVQVTGELPPQKPSSTQLRIRLPTAYRITSAETEERSLAVTDETIDLTTTSGAFALTIAVAGTNPAAADDGDEK